MRSLTDEQVKAIYLYRLRDEASCSVLARAFGVSRNVVAKIARREQCRHITASLPRRPW